MFIDFLLDVFEKNRAREAVIWRGAPHTYAWMLDRIVSYAQYLRREDVGAGRVVLLEADYSPDAIALLLALIDRGCIIVPLTPAVEAMKPEFSRIAMGEASIVLDEGQDALLRWLPVTADHPVYAELRRRGHPGLVLFSSGSTGQSKAAVHDFVHLLEKFKVRRHDLRTLAFLLFDHIGGVDTLLYCLSNGSCLVIAESRSPEEVCRTIEKHRVEVLPVSPTFLRLLLLSEAHKRHDLRSLRYVTYGTEVMPESTLHRVVEIFPNARILQKYGTTEVGTLRSSSRSPDSLWLKIGGEGFETRVVEGILQIKAHSAMLGYLNAPSPFTPDGWFNTGDSVEVDGEYIRILGRKSDLINVGGEKVYPAEVENVLLQMGNVVEATVYGEKNAILGMIVCAKVTILHEEDEKEFMRRMRRHFLGRLEPFKIPVKIRLSRERQHSQRFKKIRKT